MIKKVILLMFSMILSLPSFATTWKYEGGLDGEAGLMIVYKTLPPLVVEVDEPETMTVARGNQTFKYSEVSKSKQPLNVKIEIYFDPSIVTDNGVNKEIVRTIYDTANLSFLDNGKFYLRKESNEKLPKNISRKIDISNQIDGEVFFTNRNGVIEGVKNGKTLSKKIGDTIQNGVLSESDIYIDAHFNKEQKEMLSGTYGGTATLVVEFLGKGGTQSW